MNSRRKLSVLFIALSFCLASVQAKTYLHAGPGPGESEKILIGHTISHPTTKTHDEPSSQTGGTSPDRSSHVVDFAVHIKRNVVLWNELMKENITISKCMFYPRHKDAIIEFSGQDLDVEDFEPGAVFVIEIEHLEEECEMVFEPVLSIDESDNVLFYEIKREIPKPDGKIEIGLTLIPGRDVVPQVDFFVHEEPVDISNVDGSFVFDREGESTTLSKLSRIAHVNSNQKELALSTSSHLVHLKKEIDIIDGVKFKVDVRVQAGVRSFKLKRVLRLEFEWEQSMEASLMGKLEVFKVSNSIKKTGEIYRRFIPGLSLRVGIPFAGRVSAGAFYGINWVAELDISAGVVLTASATYKRKELVTASLIPRRISARNLLAPGEGTSASLSSVVETSVQKARGFIGIRPVIGAGITVEKRKLNFTWRKGFYWTLEDRKSIEGNIGVNIGLEALLATSSTRYFPYTGSGLKLGVCSTCHFIQGGVSFVVKKFSVQVVKGSTITSENVLAQTIYTKRLATMCLVTRSCTLPTSTPTPTPTLTPRPATTCSSPVMRHDYLRCSTSQLWHLATYGRRIGGCYIAVSSSSTASCDIYVKAARPGSTGDRGWPRTRYNTGTGCVKAPDFPRRRVSTCYYASSDYILSSIDRASFCTNSGKENAVAQLRHALRHQACALPGDISTSTPPSTSPPSHTGPPRFIQK